LVGRPDEARHAGRCVLAILEELGLPDTARSGSRLGVPGGQTPAGHRDATTGT